MSILAGDGAGIKTLLIGLCPEGPWGWIIPSISVQADVVGLGLCVPHHHARTIIALVVQLGRALPPPLQLKIPLPIIRVAQAAVAFFITFIKP